MSELTKQVEETVQYIYAHTAYRPEIAIILGSGLGQLGERVADADIIPYETLPHWKKSTAPGHSGRLIFGMLGGSVS